MINEKELAKTVARAKDNDSNALARLCEYLYPKIYSFCFYKVSHKEDAKDLTGEVLLKIMKSLKKQKGSFSGWIYRIASNHVIDFYRRQARRNIVEVHKEPGSYAFYSTENEVENMLKQEQLKAALGQLTEEQRVVTIHKFIQGYNNEEIAQIMEKTVGAVKGLQFRALRSLKDLLEVD